MAALFIVVVPLTFGEYYISILNLVLIAIVGALGLNILVGYTGQVSIGHGAFMSVGAYTAANLITRLGMPFWVAIPAGGLMAAFDRHRSSASRHCASRASIWRSPPWRRS